MDSHVQNLSWITDQDLEGAAQHIVMDDELVATDVGSQNNFPSSQGELVIGAANSRQSGTFWSGLIDDVRIYDRAVVP